MENDSKNVVSAVNNCYEFSAIPNVVVDIKHMLNRASNRSCYFIPRKGNRVAHVLVRLASSYQNAMYWLEEFPSDVVDLMYSDMVSY